MAKEATTAQTQNSKRVNLFVGAKVSEEELAEIETMALKYYRFKVYWKQVAIKKYLEEHIGVKYNKVREIKRLKLNQGTPHAE